MKSIAESVREMRNTVLGHAIFKPGDFSLVSVPGVSLNSLRDLLVSVVRLFDLCSFGTTYYLSLYPVDPETGEADMAEVDQIMEVVFKNSPWLTRPERNPVFWADIRQHIPKGDLDEMDHWRKKLGMSGG